VRLEQGADVGVVAFFDGGAVAVAGVVDQHIDAAEPLFCLLHSGGDLFGTGDVKRKGEHTFGRALGQVGDSRDVAGGDDGVVAFANDGFGEGTAESGRAAGDEPCGHVSQYA
jgi:hypothetical protein